jgi:hypothetical protein
MADFAKWAYAAGGGDEFLTTYNANRQDAIAAGLEGSPVATAIRALITNQDSFSDTSTVLLGELVRYADEQHLRLRSWPKSAKALSNQLRRLATALRAVGIEIEWPPRRGNARIVQIQKVCNLPSPSSPPSPSVINQSLTGDAPVAKGDTVVTQDKIYRHQPSHCFQKARDAGDDSDAKNPTLSYDGAPLPALRWRRLSLVRAMITLPTTRRGRRSEAQQAEYDRQMVAFCDQIMEINKTGFCRLGTRLVLHSGRTRARQRRLRQGARTYGRSP